MKSTRLLAAAAAAALALLAVPPVASAKDPATAVGRPATGATSLQQVEKEMLLKRYEAVAAYAKANPKAADAEEAGKRVVDLAEEAELWDKVVVHATDFAAAFPKSTERVDTETSKAQALVHLGRVDEAKKAWRAATDALVKEKHGPGKMWQTWEAYATFLVDVDDVEGAKAAYAAAKESIGHPQVNQMVDDAVKWLAILGTEPTAFPEGTKDVDGKALSLADFKGKVVMIDFWATWCGPCRAEIPNVVAAYKKWHDKGFEVVGVSLDKDGDEQKVRDFTKEHAMPWRQYYDGKYWENEISTLYGIHSIPQTILVGKDGKVVKVGVRGEAIDKALAKLLK